MREPLPRGDEREFDLTWQGLLKVRTMALGAAADATPFHAANASGTFAYHYGIYGLRDEFVGKHWRADRPKGIEVIRNEAKNMLVGFANVDVACNDEHEPIAQPSRSSAPPCCPSPGNLPSCRNRCAKPHLTCPNSGPPAASLRPSRIIMCPSLISLVKTGASHICTPTPHS